LIVGGPDEKGDSVTQGILFARSRELIAAISLFILSCAGTEIKWLEQTPEPDVESPPFRITGEVHYMDVEGGLFVITGTDGVQYNPINLPESFKSDGANVEADVRRRDDLVTTAMVGPVIEVLRIRARSGE
jgi:hypothetical protein